MNAARLRKLAAHIGGIDAAEFDMGQWCGTAACIAGWAVRIFASGYEPLTSGQWLCTAADILDLSFDEVRWLCIPATGGVYVSDATPADAALVLDLVAGGETPINAWRRVMSAVERAERRAAERNEADDTSA